MGEKWDIRITWGMNMKKQETFVQFLYLIRDAEHDSQLGFQEAPERY